MKPTLNVGEYALDVGKLTPPAAVTAVASSGHSLSDWVQILTIVYTALMIVNLLYKVYRDRTRGE